MLRSKKSKAAYWLALIEEWQHSQLNKKAFCLSKAINYRNFTQWYSRIIQPRKQAANAAAVSPLFIPVTVKRAKKINAPVPTKPWVLRLNKQLALHIPVESVDSTLLNVLFKSLGVLPC